MAVSALSSQASCRSEDRTEANAYFPLAANDTWVYEISRSSENEHARLTVHSKGDHFVGPLRKTAYVVEESYTAHASEPPGEPYILAYYQDEGFVSRAMSLEYHGEEIVEIGPHAGEQRFLPVRLSETSKWSGTTAYDVSRGAGYAVEQTHAAVREPDAVVVPGGRFSGCIRVETVAVQQVQEDGQKQGPSTVLYYRDWYAPNVGLVRSTLSNRQDQSAVLAETRLLSFVPGKESH